MIRVEIRQARPRPMPTQGRAFADLPIRHEKE
jgi:hypothetical protein